MAAHFLRWLEATTYGWPFWFAEEFTPVIVCQLHATHSGRFALRHTWNW